jgi:hypothetical protein
VNTSVCKSFSCPYWSDGIKAKGAGSLGGYGCSKYSVAGHCPVSQTKGVTDTQYELFINSQTMCPNQATVIALVIGHLVFKDIKDADKRRSLAAHIKLAKEG